MYKELRMNSLYVEPHIEGRTQAMSKELQQAVDTIKQAKQGEAYLDAEIGAIDFYRDVYCDGAPPTSVMQAVMQHEPEFRYLCFKKILEFCLAFDRAPSGAEEIQRVRKLVNRYCMVCGYFAMHHAGGREERAEKLVDLVLYRSHYIIAKREEWAVEMLQQVEPLSHEEMIQRVKEELIGEHRESYWK
jgi:hypothetical protein